MHESSEITERLDENGFQVGGILEIEPINGKKKKLQLKRTKFNFVSRHFEKEQLKGCFVLLPEMKTERFLVELKEIQTKTQTQMQRKRFIVKVIEGTAIKLNGSFHMESFIENGDKLEIGYNTIYFRENSLEVPPEDSFFREQKRVITSDLPILLYGETGVGKSSLAKRIHEQSARPGQFVQINIAAFSKNLLESELFGHVKGAFTGAQGDKTGLLKQANYGTIFIDEIDSLPLETQTKLLLFLDDQTITPVGSLSKVSLDVRLIFASGRKLSQLVEDKIMRKDFYFRLTSGASYQLKSLRDDPQKIEAFCQKFCLDNHITISQKLISFYTTLPWPGNYRQLQGHLVQKNILCPRDRLNFDSLDERLIEQSSELSCLEEGSDKRPSMREMKRLYALKIYYEMDKNMLKASRHLEISSKCLKNLIAS